MPWMPRRNGPSNWGSRGSAQAPHPPAGTFSPPAGRRKIIGKGSASFKPPPLKQPAWRRLAFSPQTGRWDIKGDTPSGYDALPSPRLRGEGAGRRMRGERPTHHPSPSTIASCRALSATSREAASGATFACVKSAPFFTGAVTVPPSSSPHGTAFAVRASSAVMIHER